MLESMSTKNSQTSEVSKRLRVVMLADANKPQIQERAAELRLVLEKHVDVVAMINDFSEGVPTDEVDFAVVLGGDGSMLPNNH
jgi:NAD kinase